MTTLTCKNCNTAFEGRYCSNCGQKDYTEKDKSVKHLIEEVFHFITHFEGAFFTTLKTIFTKPGKLTVDYCNGVRKKYFKPISFYLLIVVIYLVFPMFKGLNTEMVNYKTSFGSKIIVPQIEQKMQERQISEEKLSEAFEVKSHTVAKFMLLVLIPFSALVLSVLFFRKRVLFDFFILATEINIFFLLGMFLVLPLILIPLIFAGLTFLAEDNTVGPMVATLFTAYCLILFHKVFQSKWWVSLFRGLAFAALHILLILPMYKLLVFKVTFLLL
jgi:hypothetical protein